MYIYKFYSTIIDTSYLRVYTLSFVFSTCNEFVRFVN